MNEEDIKILEELIVGAKTYGQYEGNKYYKAIENLIARNKELESELCLNNEIHKLKERIKDLEETNDCLHESAKDYIPKSKVKEKIEELDIKHLKDRIDITIEPCSYFYMAIEMATKKLQELLD